MPKKNREELSFDSLSAGTAVAELPPAQEQAVEPTVSAPAPVKIQTRPSSHLQPSQWDQVAHVWDWFALYLLLGCVGLIVVLHIIDLVRIPFVH
jgi:hypothetical protein